MSRNVLGRMLAVGADDNALLRLHKWIGAIRVHVNAIKADPQQQTPVRTIAEGCSVTAARLLDHLKDVRIGTAHDAQFLARAVEIATDLAVEYHLLQMQPIFESPLARDAARTGAGIANVMAKNASRKADADQKALNRFGTWESNPRRSTALASLSRVDRVRKYLKVGSPTDRDARRLRSMLGSGLIK